MFKSFSAGNIEILALLDGLREPEHISAHLESTSFSRSVVQSLLVALLGATLFGAWSGLYSMTLAQLAASALKAPLLLIGTTALCFPMFFVVQYVLAPRALTLKAALLLQASSIALVATTWAVVALPCSLFIANAENYRATKILVTLVAAFGGVVGMIWFVRGFRNATMMDGRRGSVLTLAPYCVLFGLVGAQLAWSLRPFIGSPSMPFSLFRPTGGNLFESLFF
jgi:hypothetical protein